MTVCYEEPDRTKLFICKQDPPHCQHLCLLLVNYRRACHRETKTHNFFLFRELWKPNQQTFVVGPPCCRIVLMLKSIWPKQTKLTGFLKKRKPMQSYVCRKAVQISEELGKRGEYDQNTVCEIVKELIKYYFPKVTLLLCLFTQSHG